MSDTSVFRVFAEEAMRNAARATSEAERQALEDLACTWAQAALASDRLFGSSFVASPRDDGEAPSRARS
jgi:hypothetical protein